MESSTSSVSRLVLLNFGKYRNTIHDIICAAEVEH